MDDHEVHTLNITTAKTVSDTLRSTLGPYGQDKMLVDDNGWIIVTNDGITILNRMDFEMDLIPPGANAIVELGNRQDDAVGDGTTTAIILAGEFLDAAEILLDQDIHPTTIASGYLRAAERATETIAERSTEISSDDIDILRRISQTVLDSKGVNEESIADLIVETVRALETDGQIKTGNIKIEQAAGKSVADSHIIEGMVLERQRAHPNMPPLVKDARVALFGSELSASTLLPVETTLSIDSADQLRRLQDEEAEQRRQFVSRIIDADVDFVVCFKGIDDTIAQYLVQENILAIERLNKDDVKRIARATGAKPIQNPHEIDETFLGRVASVKEGTLGTDNVTFIHGGETAETVSIVLHGGTVHTVEELARVVQDTIGAVSTTVQNSRVVPGGGAIEIEVAQELADYATGLSTREQLAVQAFAGAFEAIPSTLAKNAGQDSAKALTQLHARHADGKVAAGIDVETGEPVDMMDIGVIESSAVKAQAVQGAAATASQLLRIDEIIHTNAGQDDKAERMESSS